MIWKLSMFELKKVFTSSKIWLVFIATVCMHGVIIWNICYSDLPDYKDIYKYNQNTYSTVINQAEQNITSGSDVSFMKSLVSRYSAREWNYNAYDSREADLMNDNLSIFFGIIISILVAVELLDTERYGNMRNLVCTVGRKNRNVMAAKIIAIAIAGLLLQIVFGLESMLGYMVGGGVNPFLHVYLVPGYFFSWFQGNILECRVIILLGAIGMTWFFSYFSFLFAYFVEDSIKAILIAGGIFLLLFTVSDQVPLKFSGFSSLGFLKPQTLFQDYTVSYLGNGNFAFPIYISAMMLLVYLALILMVTILSGSRRGKI